MCESEVEGEVGVHEREVCERQAEGERGVCEREREMCVRTR